MEMPQSQPSTSGSSVNLQDNTFNPQEVYKEGEYESI